MKKKNKVYVTLNPAERRLLVKGLLFFRNKVIAREINMIDICRSLIKAIKKTNDYKLSKKVCPIL